MTTTDIVVCYPPPSTSAPTSVPAAGSLNQSGRRLFCVWGRTMNANVSVSSATLSWNAGANTLNASAVTLSTTDPSQWAVVFQGVIPTGVPLALTINGNQMGTGGTSTPVTQTANGFQLAAC
jgi:hypothetical protein